MRKSTLWAAVIVGASILSPLSATAQVEDSLRNELIALGVADSDLTKLEMATEEQIQQLEAIVEGDGDQQQKEDEVAAIMAEIE